MEAVSELSIGHDLVTESVVEPSICPVSLYGPDHELSTCEVSVSEPGCELLLFQWAPGELLMKFSYSLPLRP